MKIKKLNYSNFHKYILMLIIFGVANYHMYTNYSSQYTTPLTMLYILAFFSWIATYERNKKKVN